MPERTFDLDGVIAAYHARTECPCCHRRGRLFAHADYCVLWGVPLAVLQDGGE